MEIDFNQLAVTDYGSVLKAEHFLDYHIKPLWAGMPPIFGPAFTVKLVAGDNLMLHAAIYEAPKGSIIVVDAGDDSLAVAGGNVCAVAKKRGIKGFIIDGVIRDLGEIKSMGFPVYARGVFPVPGAKKVYQALAQPIHCGGALVNTSDMMVADEEGIAVIPASMREDIFAKAARKASQDQAMTLDEWQASHHEKIQAALVNAKANA